MSVILRNKTTGETKTVKVGFSWILFFFAGFFGIPLFMRRLYVWGSVFLVYWLIYAFGAHFVDNYDAACKLPLQSPAVSPSAPIGPQGNGNGKHSP